jgi:hypothetical protein
MRQHLVSCRVWMLFLEAITGKANFDWTSRSFYEMAQGSRWTAYTQSVSNRWLCRKTNG